MALLQISTHRAVTQDGGSLVQYVQNDLSLNALNSTRLRFTLCPMFFVCDILVDLVGLVVIIPWRCFLNCYLFDYN